MFGRSLSIQAIIAIAGIWSALPVEGFQCVRAHKAEWANDIEIWGFNCPWRKGVEDRCYFLNCSDGHQIRSEWGCVSDFDDGDLSNCESYPNYFEDNGFKCACQIGEKDKDMSNRDMAIPFTTTTTTTTATPHLCIQATIEGPESTENKTLSEEQCKAGEMLCFFYNCTLAVPSTVHSHPSQHPRPVMSPSPSMSASCSDFPESQERLQRLQMTRDSLSFQVAVLSRQVALQREKIRDLEESLGGTSSPKQHIRGAGQSQQKEIGQQLDELRHKYLALEREKTEAERFLIMSNIEVDRVSQHSPERKDTKIDELEKLQMAVRSLMADNEQKNSLIQTLQNALEEQQRRMLGANLYQQQNGVPSHQLDINEQIRRILLLDDLSLDGSDQSMMAHSSSFPAGLCGQSLRSSPRRSPQPAPASGPAPARQHFPTSTSFSSSLSHLKTTGMIPPPPLWREPPTHLPQLEQPSTSSSGRTPASPLARQLAAELDELRQSGMGALLRQPYSSASLPRSIHSKSNSFGTCATNRLRQAVESDDELASARGSVPNSQTLDGHLSAKRLKRGRRARSTLRSFLGRFTHRGNSLQDVRPSPRCAPLSLPPALPPHGGPSPCFSVRPPISQFVDWDCAHCSRWLTEVGFGDALVGAVRSGRHLLSMLEADFETESWGQKRTPAEAAQVMLWLDQIGLPQLRDSFAENRVNGHLLLVLSMQDLMELGIQSALNHASLARAIQFLRSVDFHLHRLEKHFSSELLSHCPIPAQVERWSHCCVVEWLRSEDLDEFTPNLAFSGLHGALMVYEPTFTAESLAEMLQISPTKTLIRRHLSTQFNSVLGQQCSSTNQPICGLGLCPLFSLADRGWLWRCSRGRCSEWAPSAEHARSGLRDGELGVRSALQRKRLKCMLDRIERNSETEAADKMDTNMVMLWLDQIGLPQLRDSFAENRVNGHLLLVLSMQDLMELGIQSALNHASLARAIQFLRSVDFHLHRLEKHFSSELLSHCPIPAQVERWSHCCVVEWLRSEDLDEFTPNLAFSGLHGALMVYEPTFTAESLAEMLQIPPTKTLIRRHLSTQFNSVLGQQIVGNKRETVSQPMVVHLTPGLRIRLAKGGFSLGRKKSKSDIFVEPEVRVCPEVWKGGLNDE
uniref:SAM domain-containing protein n=1 Tax=Globodera pallida TaxID=36090 RepID=A0A183BKZ5_GLOPA